MAILASTALKTWHQWLPGIATLRSYQLASLKHDFFAGLALAAILVPVGMGYAQASGLPAIYGLYATIVPLLVYALLGPSRIMVLGPDSTLAASVVVKKRASTSCLLKQSCTSLRTVGSSGVTKEASSGISHLSA